MINNLRWIGALGAVYVACAAVGTAQAAAPDDRAEARGPGQQNRPAPATGAVARRAERAERGTHPGAAATTAGSRGTTRR